MCDFFTTVPPDSRSSTLKLKYIPSSKLWLVLLKLYLRSSNFTSFVGGSMFSTKRSVVMLQGVYCCKVCDLVNELKLVILPVAVKASSVTWTS